MLVITDKLILKWLPCVGYCVFLIGCVSFIILLGPFFELVNSILILVVLIWILRKRIKYFMKKLAFIFIRQFTIQQINSSNILTQEVNDISFNPLFIYGLQQKKINYKGNICTLYYDIDSMEKLEKNDFIYIRKVLETNVIFYIGD
jgi:hypothetical protein